MNVDLVTSYPTAEAERGKFAVIDSSTITDYPSGGRGRYAVLTYSVGSEVGASYTPETATSSSTSAVQIEGGANATITTAVSTFTFSPVAKFMEIYNNSSNKLYIKLNTTSTYSSLTAEGLIIPTGAFYTLDKFVETLEIGADGADSDVRIHAHS